MARFVAQAIDDTQDLGEKGKRGILHTMNSRMAYLEDDSHRIRFVYTPKHCSWLNPVEVWFSVLGKHVLHRGNFTSVTDLRSKIERYVVYYNTHLAKAYQWSVVKTKDIQQLIGKVMHTEGAIQPTRAIV